MESLFGIELSLPVKFLVAFVIVLVLIGIAAVVVRRFGAGAREVAGQRSRQPRLAIVDATAIDNRRRLVIIRRDNVEHLLLIGGPTDVLIEPNINRASVPMQTARETPAVRAAAAEQPPMVAPALPEAASVAAPAPEPVFRPMPKPVEAPTAWPLQPQPEPMPRPAPVVIEQPVRVIAPEPFVIPPAPAPVVPAEVVPPAPPAATPAAAALDPLAGLAAALQLGPEPRPSPGVQAVVPSPAEERNIADMAHRLEAALRRPLGAPGSPLPAVRPVPAAAPVPAPQPVTRAKPPEPPRAPPGPPQERPTASTYESLQREMASLLGRPSGSS